MYRSEMARRYRKTASLDFLYARAAQLCLQLFHGLFEFPKTVGLIELLAAETTKNYARFRVSSNTTGLAASGQAWVFTSGFPNKGNLASYNRQK